MISSRGAVRLAKLESQGPSAAIVNIQFAVLWKGARLDDWQLRSVNSLLALPNVRASLLIRADAPSSHAEPLPGILGTLPIVAAGGMPSHGARSPAAEAHGARPEYDLDFILSFTDSPCSSEMLGAARYGVWAFRFGDSAQDCAETAGFWEVYAGEPVTVARLVRLQPSPDEFVVLREGHLPTRALSVDANRRDVLDRITPWAALACSDIRNGVTRRLMAPPLIRTMPARKPPSAGRRLDCKRRIAARIVKTLARSLFRHDHWNVGYVDRPISWFLDHAPAQIAWLPPPTRNEFFADPFGTWRDGRLTILFERFDYRSNLGSISAIEHPGAAAAVPVQIGPHPAVHLSYPYLIDAGDRLLCIPETSPGGRDRSLRGGALSRPLGQGRGFGPGAADRRCNLVPAWRALVACGLRSHREGIHLRAASLARRRDRRPLAAARRQPGQGRRSLREARRHSVPQGRSAVPTRPGLLAELRRTGGDHSRRDLDPDRL